MNKFKPVQLNVNGTKSQWTVAGDRFYCSVLKKDGLWGIASAAEENSMVE